LETKNPSGIYKQCKLRYRYRVVDLDPHHFGKLDPDPYKSGKLDPDPDAHQSGKPDPDPDPHQSEKVEALEGHFGALEGPNLEKVSGRIRIRIQIRLKGMIRIRIKICIRVKGKIRIRIKVMQIHNTDCNTLPPLSKYFKKVTNSR
jgi:hypothetical protein